MLHHFQIRFKWQVLRTRLFLDRLRAKNFLFPVSVFVLTTSALMVYYNLFQYTSLWQEYTLASGNAFHFCEANQMDSFIRQPSNTWSNLAFLLVGLFTLTLGIQDLKYSKRKESDNFLVRYPIFSIMFGLSAIYLFIGSFFYHASLTSFFQKMDQAGMYSLVVMVITFNIYKIFPLIRINGKWKSSHAVWVAFAAGANYLILTTMVKFNINILFPALVIIAFLTSVYYLLFVSREHYFTKYLWAAFIILILSAVIWILDRTNTICSPTSIFQGHALWHILNAISILFVYMYYRSGAVPVQKTIEWREERRRKRLGITE